MSIDVQNLNIQGIKINYYSNTSLIFLYKFKKCLKV